MVKQLKVIVDNSYVPASGGYITANFTTPISIEAGSMIALDKFNGSSKLISLPAIVPSQTFSVSTLVGEAQRSVTIPAFKSSLGVATPYLEQLTQYVNQSFSGLELIGPSIAECDQKAGLALTIARNSAEFGGSILKYTYSGLIAMSSSVSLSNTQENLLGVYRAISVGTTQTITTPPLIKGGGISITGILQLALANVDDVYFEFAIQDALTGFRHGIVQTSASSNLFVFDGLGNSTEIVNSQTLFPSAYLPIGSGNNSIFFIVQRNGFFDLGYVDDATLPIPVIQTGIITPGQMGTWSYSKNYIGVYECVDAAVPYYGFTEGFYTPAFNSGATGLDTENLDVIYDLTNAPSLRTALGFVAPIIQLIPYAEITGQAISPNIIDFNDFKASFELALEITDMSLENYTAKSSRRPGDRRNVLAYFSPIEESPQSGIYSFASGVHQWLEILNKKTFTIQSLTFRVYNPYTDIAFVTASMGFNILIKSPSEIENRVDINTKY